MSDNTKGEGKTVNAKGLDFDLQDFELEIDKEIDSLFIPVSPTPDAEEADAPAMTESPAEVELDLELEEEKEEPPAPKPVKAAAPLEDSEKATAEPGKGLDLDFSAFEAQIDMEIDSLFVPVGFKADDAPPAAPEPPPTMPVAPAAPAPEPQIAALRMESETKAPEPAPAAPSQKEPAPPEPPKPSAREALLEELNVAYLSLDWEFSAENVERMDTALVGLESHFRKSTASDSLYKLLRAVLHRLKTRPASVNSRILEILKDAQGLVGPITAQDVVPAQELQSLRSLIMRYQRMREEEMADVRTPKDEREDAPLTDAPAAKKMSFERPEAFDWETFRDVVTWIAEERELHERALSALTEENQRLYQIEEILGRTPALNPLRVRLGRIRLAISQTLVTMGGKEEDWEYRMSWMNRFEESLEARAAEPAQPEPAPTPSAPAVEEAPPAPEPAPAAAPMPETRRETVCIFYSAGKRLAVPAPWVVKIEKTGRGKVRKFLGRGYATLGDFKSLFGNIKKGVLGAWVERPAAELKNYRFKNMDLGAETAAPGDSYVLLLSDGTKHGMVIADLQGVEFRANVEFTPDSSGEVGILGSVLTESGATVPVVDFAEKF